MHIDYGIEDKIEYCRDIILKEARKEDKLSYQIFITMLSAYSNNPINLLINAPSGVGKNYVINIVSSLFPQSDILSLAGMTEKVLTKITRSCVDDVLSTSCHQKKRNCFLESSRRCLFVPANYRF